MSSFWTATRAARLGYLVAMLTPIEQIAEEFGRGESVIWNAIDRLGLSYHEAYAARGVAVPAVDTSGFFSRLRKETEKANAEFSRRN